MKKITFLFIASVIIMTSCVKKLETLGVYNDTEIIGTVIENSTYAPIQNVIVKVTDGDHIHASANTNYDGAFRIKVKFDEIDDKYYLLLDGSPNLPSKQEELHGFGLEVFDYKTIVLYDKTDQTLLPQVVTGDVSNVMEQTATISGTVSSNGGHALIERGICYATHQSPTIDDHHSSAGSELGAYSCNINGLQATTTYYFRAYAKNSIGTAYGEQKSFTSGNGMAIVTISAVTNITSTTAVCSGDVTFDGGHPITDKGLCWSTSQYPTISNSHVSLGTGTGYFSGSMTGLSLGNTYYVRAYATNSNGTVYSDQKSFTTANGLPVVTTTAPTKTGTTVTTGGNVTSDGGYAITARGVCYGLTPYPDLGSAHQHTTNGSGTGSYSSTFTMSGTGVYYIRAYATNANGTVYGEQKTIGHPYNDLPTFTFGGRTYRVAPPADNTMNWSTANSHCNNLTLYGYSDWRLPTKDELKQMYRDRESIGGFNTGCWWSGTSVNSSCHYYVSFYDGSASYHYQNSQYDNALDYVRPVRVEN